MQNDHDDNDQTPNPICTVDPYAYLQIKLNPDGTITRLMDYPSVPPSLDLSSNNSLILTQDFPLNQTHNTFVRVYLPKLALTLSSKLPIIIYCHGGGFVLLHADSAFFADFCEMLAVKVPAIVVSVEYRLAPENRLPAAYEDAVEAVHWTAAVASLQVSPHVDEPLSEGLEGKEWLSKYGDCSNCYLMGSSAGGNIAYHAALRVSDHVDDLQPLILKGLILHQPFFGGPGRTGSEIRLANDPFLPLSGNDLFWELALPVGSGRAHEFCDPIAGRGPGLGRVRELGWRVLVTGCTGDPLVDRLVEFVKVLEEEGVDVEGSFTEGGYHGVEIMEPQKGVLWFDVVKKFVGFCLD